MASRIAGITIEIDGDTTKLQKSLKGVDSDLKATSAKLRDVEKLLKLDPKNTELLRQKQQALSDSIEKTKERLSALKDAQSQFAKGTEEWDSIQREIIATEQNLDNLERDYRNFGSVAKQQMLAVGKSMQDAGKKVTELGNKLKPLSTAAGGVLTGLGTLAYKSVTAADDLASLSKQTGISTDELQKMQYASDLVDVSVEDITGALRKMKPKMDDSNETFQKLGISVKDADGNMRGATDVFYDSLKALQGISNETERDQIAMELFGKGADSLAGIIDDGGAALRAYGNEAARMGLIMSGDTIDALNQTNDTIDKTKNTLLASAAQLGATAAQVLAPLIERLSAGLQRISEWMRQLSPQQVDMVLKIAGVVAAVAPLLIIGGKLITGIGAIVSALGFLMSPIGLVVVAIAALVAAGVALYKNWDKIKEAAENLRKNIAQAWEKFKKNTVDTFETVKNSVSQKCDSIKNTVTNRAQSIKNSVVNTWNNLKNAVQNANNGMQNILSSAWSNLRTAASNHFNGIKTTISNVMQNVKNSVSNIWSNIYNNFINRLSALGQSVYNVFSNIWENIKNTMQNIRNLFSGITFNFPHIKLPHFSWEWIDLGGLVSIPRIYIDWYKKAYENPVMFTSPTVLGTASGLKGFGDGHGAEIVMGLDKLRELVGSQASGVNITIVQQPWQNAKELAHEVQKVLVSENRQKAAAGYA